MTQEQFRNLKIGDLVQHKHKNGIITGTWVITGNYGGRATAVNSVDLTNPEEWNFIYPEPKENIFSDKPTKEPTKEQIERYVKALQILFE